MRVHVCVCMCVLDCAYRVSMLSAHNGLHNRPLWALANRASFCAAGSSLRRNNALIIETITTTHFNCVRMYLPTSGKEPGNRTARRSIHSSVYVLKNATKWTVPQSDILWGAIYGNVGRIVLWFECVAPLFRRHGGGELVIQKYSR